MQQGAKIGKHIKQYTLILNDDSEIIDEIIIQDNRKGDRNPVKVIINDESAMRVSYLPREAAEKKYDLIREYSIPGSDKFILPVILDDKQLAVNVLTCTGDNVLLVINIPKINSAIIFPESSEQIKLVCHSQGIHELWTELDIEVIGPKVSIKKHNNDILDAIDMHYYEAIKYDYLADTNEYNPESTDFISIGEKIYKKR